MTNPLDESAKAAAEWVETTPDTVLQACGLVNAYQLGWMDGAMRCADKQAAKRVRPRIGTIPVADQGPAGRHRGHRGQGRVRHGMGGALTNPKKNGDLMLRVRYDSGAELAGPAVITDEGALLVSLGGAASMLVQRADGSLPPHITFVDIRPSHVGYGLPLTDDMAYMAVTAMLRDAVGLPLNEAADRYESWLNRVRRNAIEKWVDSLPERESTQLHVKYLDRDGAGRPKEEGDA
ncbi:hypothetical protein [Bifidobacterium longum]|nr:hypothetical protein [Bifidobacterium longum]